MIKFKLIICNNFRSKNQMHITTVIRKKKQNYPKRALKSKAKRIKANLNHHHIRHLHFLVRSVETIKAAQYQVLIKNRKINPKNIRVNLQSKIKKEHLLKIDKLIE